MPETRDTWHPLVPLLIDHILTRVESKVNHFRRYVVKKISGRWALISIVIGVASVVSLALLTIRRRVVWNWRPAVGIVEIHT